jgi:Ca-activated chloride channel homolog
VIAPLALIGLISLPIIVAYYMLRLRRRDVPVGSTFLWQQLVRDVEANAPWQRLRFSWLLVLQLLIALVAVIAAARPFLTVSSDLAANVVLIVDTSASMGTVEAGSTRIAEARLAARRVIGDLPEGGHVTVVAADDSAHVLVSDTDDRAAALAAIDRIAATQVPGDLTDAFALASALAARDSDSTVVVVTDANADRLPKIGMGAPVHVERVGSTDANQAVAALSLLRRSGGAELDLFVAVSNPSGSDVTRRLEIYADDVLVDARDLAIPAEQRSEAVINSVPQSAKVVEARLAGTDALAVDDRAFALVPQAGAVRALLVGPGNTYLENALALLPRLELYAVGAEGYATAISGAISDGKPYGIVIFDRTVPDQVPSIPALYVGPTKDGAFGKLGGVLDGPILDRTDPADPLLRFLDLSTLHIGRARAVTLADGMRAVISTPAGSPLVAAGRVDGRGVALLSFALGDSDLPLQVAFPLLMSNLVDALLPSVDGVLPPSVQLGEPIAISVDPAIRRVAAVAASGEQIELDVIGGRVTVPGPRVVGLVDLQVVDDGTGHAGGSLGETAANLFNPGESRVTPGDPARIVDLGSVGPRPGTGALSARSEWWWPLALAGLLLLLAEWILFHRPTRRALARLLGRSTPPASGRSATPAGPTR